MAPAASWRVGTGARDGVGGDARSPGGHGARGGASRERESLRDQDTERHRDGGGAETGRWRDPRNRDAQRERERRGKLGTELRAGGGATSEARGSRAGAGGVGSTGLLRLLPLFRLLLPLLRGARRAPPALAAARPGSARRYMEAAAAAAGGAGEGAGARSMEYNFPQTRKIKFRADQI